MPRRAAVKSTTPTRERILDAAISWFSRHSYEATGLRDIAALAEVDVAYVHRCFGSKKQLFAEAVRAQIRPEELLRESTGDDIAASLAALVFAHDGARDRGEIGPFDIMNHSLSSIEARDILRDFITAEIIPLFASKMGVGCPIRAASLIVAYLAGLGMLRNVIDIEPLQDASGGWLEASSRAVIATILADGGHLPGH
ncbi:MAG: TetR/AcrR family transcriptional regulator [Agrobacterium sp.]|uniref:TetR/AcrR family transcriptional regulator n=1 Tax=Agrobacterium sp. TaxID=361 RepID=UPI0040332BCB